MTNEPYLSVTFDGDETCIEFHDEGFTDTTHFLVVF